MPHHGESESGLRNPRDLQIFDVHPTRGDEEVELGRVDVALPLSDAKLEGVERSWSGES